MDLKLQLIRNHEGRYFLTATTESTTKPEKFKSFVHINYIEELYSEQTISFPTLICNKSATELAREEMLELLLQSHEDVGPDAVCRITKEMMTKHGVVDGVANINQYSKIAAARAEANLAIIELAKQLKGTKDGSVNNETKEEA